MPSANTRHRASPRLFQYDHESFTNRSRIYNKGVENNVLGGLGAPWEVPWGHFRPRGGPR